MPCLVVPFVTSLPFDFGLGIVTFDAWVNGAVINDQDGWATSAMPMSVAYGWQRCHARAYL